MLIGTKKGILPEFYGFCFRFGMKSWPCLPKDGLISVTLDMTGGQKTSKYDRFFFNCDFFLLGFGIFAMGLMLARTCSSATGKRNPTISDPINMRSKQNVVPSICDPANM